MTWETASRPGRRTHAWVMVAALCLLSCCAAGVDEVIAAGDPVVVPMGYARLGADGTPQDVMVALTKQQFATLVEAAAHRADAVAHVGVALGPGIWSGRWHDGRWDLTATIPAAAFSSAWGEVTMRMPGTVTSVHVAALAGGPLPAAAAWHMQAQTLVLAVPPGMQVSIQIEVQREAPLGEAVAMTFPPGGSLRVELPAGMVAVTGNGHVVHPDLGLPSTSTTVLMTADHAANAVDPGSLGFEQLVRLKHLGDRVAWDAQVIIDGQRSAPGVIALLVPTGLEILHVEGEALTTWHQDHGHVDLQWGGGTGRNRTLHLTGVMVAASAVSPLLRLPGATRGHGRIGVVDAGPVHWLPIASSTLRRLQPEADERYRVGWDGADPGVLILSWTNATEQLTADCDALLVAAPGRWRAELVVKLTGTGWADHLTLSLPAPWRVVDTQAAQWFPDGTGSVVLRSGLPFNDGKRVVVRCEAPWTSALAVDHLPAIAVTQGAAAGPTRWLVADADMVRIAVEGASTDSDAIVADLARSGVRPRDGERVRGTVEARRGATIGMHVAQDGVRTHIEVAHYLIAGAQAAIWSCHMLVTPEQGAVHQVRVQLPAGARLTQHQGEGVSSWAEADGWLTANFAAALDRPTVLDLAFAVDWSETSGHDHLEIGALNCEPAIAAQTLALAQDEEAGQLVTHVDGLAERDPSAIRLPMGVSPQLLAGHAWAASGTAWSLTVNRERLDPGIGVDGVATLVDVHSVIDPDGHLLSRATWYVINRSRSALILTIPPDCALWEVRVGGQPVRARIDATNSGNVDVPVTPLRPGEAATRIQVVWKMAAGFGNLHPVLPVFADLRVMRALWRFTAAPGTHLSALDGWEQMAASDATGARVEVLVEELKRLKATTAESRVVRIRLEDQLQMIDQELADHLAVLANLGGNASRWTKDITLNHADAKQQGEYQRRTSTYNSLACDNRQQLQQELGALSVSARQQQDRRGGLLLDGQAIIWAAVPVSTQAGPDWGARQAPPALLGAPEQVLPGGTLGAGSGSTASGASAALIGIDLLPVQEGEELTLSADSLALAPAVRLTRDHDAWPWLAILLGMGASLFTGISIARIRTRISSPQRDR